MLFVMGATGRMGGAALRHAEGSVRAGTRSGRPVPGASETVRFDLDDPGSFAAALAGCTALFAMRPPPATRRDPFDALLAAAREAGVAHVVCASVYGADRSSVLPHRHLERAVRDSGIAHTFLRPADFMQNLADVHAPRIRDEGVIALPAGQGRSAFVDVEDIGRATAAVLAAPQAHAGRGYDLTGPEALTFGEVAEILSQVLDRPIAYRPVSVGRFLVAELRSGRPASLALIMSALYTVQRLGRAAPVRPDFERLTHEAPGSLASYVARDKAAFLAE
jgi:uncharacterized protein YbjT (DUF2867 family)